MSYVWGSYPAIGRKKRTKKQAKRHMHHVVHRHILHIERHNNFNFIGVTTDIVAEASAIAASAWAEDVEFTVIETVLLPEEVAASSILLVILVCAMCLLCIAFMVMDIIGKALYKKPIIGYAYDPIYHLKQWVEARIKDAAVASVDAGWTIFHDVAKLWVWLLWKCKPLIERWIRTEIRQALIGSVPDYKHIEHQIREANRRIHEADRQFRERIDRVNHHIHRIEHELEHLPKTLQESRKVLTHIDHALATHHRHIQELHDEVATIRHEIHTLKHVAPVTVINHPSKHLQHEVEQLQHRANETSIRLNNHVVRLNHLTEEISHLQARSTNARLQTEVHELRTEVHRLTHLVHQERQVLTRIETDIPQLQRERIATDARLHHLDRRVTHEAHRISFVSGIAQELEPLSQLLPLSIRQARNLNKLKNDPCQCKGLPSLPDSDVLLDTFMLENIASDGI